MLYKRLLSRVLCRMQYPWHDVRDDRTVRISICEFDDLFLTIRFFFGFPQLGYRILLWIDVLLAIKCLNLWIITFIIFSSFVSNYLSWRILSICISHCAAEGVYGSAGLIFSPVINCIVTTVRNHKKTIWKKKT